MKNKTDFSSLSSIYDVLGLLMFQGSLHSSQVYFFDKMPKIKKALILGGGTGKFLVDLLNSVLVEKVIYVDISPGMIAKAKDKVRKLKLENKVEFICGGFESIPVGQYDLICTHYFLDCFEEEHIVEMLQVLKKSLSENGVWHFTDFYLDSGSSFLRKKFVAFLYFFFRTSCGLKVDKLANFKKVFKNTGFKRIEEKYFRRRLLRTALYKN